MAQSVHRYLVVLKYFWPVRVYQTSKMCFVIITLHKWLFLEIRSCLSSPIFAQLQAMNTSETYRAYQWGNPKNEQEIIFDFLFELFVYLPYNETYKVVFGILKLENKYWENVQTFLKKLEVKRIMRILYIFKVRASFSQIKFP